MNYTILIADDEKEIRELLKDELSFVPRFTTTKSAFFEKSFFWQVPSSFCIGLSKMLQTS